jgi:hypothetical protein
MQTTTKIDPKLIRWFTGLPPSAQQNFLSDVVERFKQTSAKQAPTDWHDWLPTLFPSYVTASFSQRHVEFWEWVWAIVKGIRPAPFIGIWPRGGAKSTSAELAVIRLGGAGQRLYGWYCSEVQDQADQHIATIADILESNPRVAEHYPLMAQREVGKYGQSKGWRRERLRCANGFILDAIGLDTARRGSKAKENRPDFLVFDDIDGKHDSPKTTLKKKEIITTSLLPAGSDDAAVLFIQNRIIPDGIASQLANVSDVAADFLTDRIVSGPYKAIDNLATEVRDGHTYIISGTPTWEGQNLQICQDAINTWGITAFLKEAQHEVEQRDGGLFNHIEFRHCVYSDVPELVDGCVWCDPAVTSTDDSDSMGIQADGLSVDDNIYRIWSWEQITTPLDCLKKAILKATELRFDRVGVETDQGGDLWADEFDMAIQDLAKDENYPQFELIDDEVVVTDGNGIVDETRRLPAFVSDKAGAGYGPKVHRWNLMLSDYEKGKIIHVIGTHNTLEKALNRVPKYKPYDLTDAAWWSWHDLRGGGTAVYVGGKRL